MSEVIENFVRWCSIQPDEDRPAVPPEAIQGAEERLGVLIPGELRDFYGYRNGFAGSSERYFSVWELHQLRTFERERIEVIHDGNLEVISGSSVLLFSDLMDEAVVFGVISDPNSKLYGVVVAVDDEQAAFGSIRDWFAAFGAGEGQGYYEGLIEIASSRDKDE